MIKKKKKSEGMSQKKMEGLEPDLNIDSLHSSPLDYRANKTKNLA